MKFISRHEAKRKQLKQPKWPNHIRKW